MSTVLRIILVRTLQISLLALLAHWLLHWPLTGPHALGLYLTPGLCLYFVFVFVAPLTWGLPILTHLPRSERVVALTFDDGPSPDITPRILDTLRTHHATATFFVLGELARAHPDLLRRIAVEGHQIGLHGDKHVPYVLAGWGAVAKDMARAQATISEICPDAPVTWLRPPHGFKTLALPLLARRLRLRLAAWSVNPGDYQVSLPEDLVRAVLARVFSGAVVLLHDGAGRHGTADALPQILNGLHAQGYRCVTLG